MFSGWFDCLFGGGDLSLMVGLLFYVSLWFGVWYGMLCGPLLMFGFVCGLWWLVAGIYW